MLNVLHIVRFVLLVSSEVIISIVRPSKPRRSSLEDILVIHQHPGKLVQAERIHELHVPVHGLYLHVQCSLHPRMFGRLFMSLSCVSVRNVYKTFPRVHTKF